VVIARNLNQATSLTDVVLVAPNTPATGNPVKSSYGVVAISSNSLNLQRVKIQGGNAMTGTAGNGGSSATQTPAAAGVKGGDAHQEFFLCDNTHFGAGGSAGAGSGSLQGVRGETAANGHRPRVILMQTYPTAMPADRRMAKRPWRTAMLYGDRRSGKRRNGTAASRKLRRSVSNLQRP
jgi:hypothetical protein